MAEAAVEIAVNGFDIDGGVVTYAVTVGETAVKKRFREFVCFDSSQTYIEYSQ